VPMLLAGGFGLAASLAPDLGALGAGRALLEILAPLAGAKPRALEALLAGSPLRFALTGIGAVLLFLGLRPRKEAGDEEAAAPAKGGRGVKGGSGVPRKLMRKAKRAAAKAARKGQLAEAGEICFHSGLL